MGWTVENLLPRTHEEWLALRYDDVTASDIGALFDAGGYRTLRQLATEKRLRCEGRRDVGPAVLRRGKIMEPAIAEALRHDHGFKVEFVHGYLRARSNDPHFRLGATKDYQAEIPADRLRELLGIGWPRAWDVFAGKTMSVAVECKFVDSNAFASSWAHGAPAYYVAQTATQAAIAGDDGGLVVALVDTWRKDLAIYAVPRADAFERKLERLVSDFWRRVDAGDELPVQAGDAADLRQITLDPGKVVTLDPAEWHPLLRQREDMKRAMTMAKDKIASIEARLMDAMGSAEFASLDGYKISWSTTSAGHRKLHIHRKR